MTFPLLNAARKICFLVKSPEKLPLVIPVAMGLLDGNGQELATQLEGEDAAKSGTRVLLATQATNRFEFVDVASPPPVSGG